MLVDERGVDLCLARTLDAVRRRIDNLPWAPAVAACLNLHKRIAETDLRLNGSSTPSSPASPISTPPA